MWAGSCCGPEHLLCSGGCEQAPGTLTSPKEGQGSQFMEVETGSEKQTKLFKLTQGEMDGPRRELEPVN